MVRRAGRPVRGPEPREPRYPPLDARLVRVDSRGRAVIPKALRAQLGGAEVLFMWWDGRRLHFAPAPALATARNKRRGGPR